MKIDFSKFVNQYADDAAFDKAMSEGGGGDYLRPGLHEVEISSVEYKKDDQGALRMKENTWVMLGLVFKGVGGDKSIQSTLFVPTATLKYGPKGTLLFAHRLKEFFTALGLNPTMGNLMQLLQEYLSDPACLVGARLKITVGYDCAHAVVARKKTDEGGMLLKLVTKEGDEICKPDGTPITGVSEEQLKLFCKSQRPEIRFNGFASVLKIEPGAGQKPLKGASAAASIFE